jgi:hypothetical protein
MALGVDHSFFAFVLFDLTGGPKLSKKSVLDSL